MHQKKSKKIFIYFFLLIIFGSINNIKLNNLNFKKINNISISGLNHNDSQVLSGKINNLNLENILFLNGDELIKIIESNSLIQNFSIFKKYPSTLNIKIEKTKFLAKINNNGKTYLIGSNGKLIKSEKKIKEIPLVFGNFINNEFLELKKMIDISNLPYLDIDSIYYFESKRWDIKMKNGILIKLPNEETLIALKYAVDLLSDDKFKQIKIIDTRLNEQIILNE